MAAKPRHSLLTSLALLLLAAGCGSDSARVLGLGDRARGAVETTARLGRVHHDGSAGVLADCPDSTYRGPVITVMGPGLNYSYPTGGYCDPLSGACESAMVPYELPANRTVTFSWSADASAACTDIHSSRWALDIADVTDQTPRIDEATDLSHWSVPSRTVTSAAVGPFGQLGTHIFYVEVTDQIGRRSLAMIRITVTAAANRPPDCTGAVADLLGHDPPNGSLARVAITGVTDPDGDPVTITATGVTQDEPLDGIGEPHTCPDAVLEGGIASVRRERSAAGNGRVYTIAFTADDGQGGVCQGTVDLCVPHDRGRHGACVKDALIVNSLDTCEPSPGDRKPQQRWAP